MHFDDTMMPWLVGLAIAVVIVIGIAGASVASIGGALWAAGASAVLLFILIVSLGSQVGKAPEHAEAE